jgi:serine/threonine protein kinase
MAHYILLYSTDFSRLDVVVYEAKIQRNRTVSIALAQSERLTMLDIDYEQGLETLKALIQERGDSRLRQDFYLLQTRLSDCIGREHQFGQDPSNTANRNEILYRLIQFTDDHFGLQFVELCRASTRTAVQTPQGQLPADGQSSVLPALWEDGAEVTVREVRYCLHKPSAILSPDSSVLYQRAKAQQIGADRLVWLKQLQVRQATPTAAAWVEALTKEDQLLQRLEREGRTDFPRRLDFASTSPVITLVHTVMQGQSWLQLFGQSGKPLDGRLIPMLLRSAIALGDTLNALHKQRVAHRALTPETILLLHGTQTSVEDIGIATSKYVPGEGPELYRAPEQKIVHAHGNSIAVPGPYTDVYQLGMILYHLITGHLPASSGEILPVRAWNEALSPELDAVLLRAIASERKLRWQTTAAFSRALRQALAQR